MFNPNSIAAVWEVVDCVQKVTGLNNESNPRKWIFLHSDGVPYVYAADLQDNIVKCNSCNKETDKKGVNFSEWKTFLELHNEKHKNDSFAFEICSWPWTYKNEHGKVTPIIIMGVIYPSGHRRL